MVSELVAEPRFSEIKRGRDGILLMKRFGHYLDSKRVMDEKTFDNFKLKVRQEGKLHFSDTTRTPSSSQDPEIWMVFKKKIVAEFPELLKCYNSWPVGVYFDGWVKNNGYAANKKFIQTRTSTSAKSKRKSNFVEAEARPTKHRKSNPEASFRPVVETRTTMRNSEQFPSRAASSSECLKKQFVGKPQPEYLRWVRGDDTDDLNTSVFQYIGRDQRAPYYPDQCLACGQPPELMPRHSTRLTSFLDTLGLSRQFESDLRSFGILHDGHFDQLCSLSYAQLRELFQVWERITYEDATVLIDGIRDHATENQNKLRSPPRNTVITCKHHSSRVYFKPIAPKLKTVLGGRQMHVLAPVAALLGIVEDAHFEGCVAAAKNPLEGRLAELATVTPFYRRLLEVTIWDYALYSS